MINNIVQQIGESFEQIGKDIAHEVVKAPKDMVGSALESVGVSTGGKKQNKQQGSNKGPQTPEEQKVVQQDEETKRAVARAALEELSGKKKQKEPTVWEKLQQEEEQKNEQKKQQKAASAKASLPQVSSKRKRGDLYGVKAKKTAAENRNVRQD